MEMQTLLVKPPQARNAIRFIFFVCGLGLASWAPMVPYVKMKLGIDDGILGLLMLLIGGGALFIMPFSAILLNKFGTRKVIFFSGISLAAVLPVLLIANSVPTIVIALFCFGMCMGGIEVSANAHSILVQKLYDKPILSGLHGIFSVGGLTGSLVPGLLMKAGLEAVYVMIFISILILIIMLLMYKKLYAQTDEAKINNFHNHGATAKNQSKWSGWINPNVLFLGALCFCAYLAEGSMLDWSAVFLHDEKKAPLEIAGIGYASFSISMAFMRLFGDKLIVHLNHNTVVIAGSLLAVAGLVIAVISPSYPGALVGFIILGLGASNIVPVLFSHAGDLKGISSSASIPVMSTMGHSGQLLGPALLGGVAEYYGISASLLLVASLMLLLCISYYIKQKKAQ